MKEKGLDQLILYTEIKNEALVRKTCALFQRLVYRNTPFAPVEEAIDGKADSKAYYDVQEELLRTYAQQSRCSHGSAPAGRGEGTPASMTVWQAYMAGLILSTGNAFAQMAERGEVDENLYALAAEEMKTIRFIYSFDFAALARAVEASTSIRAGGENIASLRSAPCVAHATGTSVPHDTGTSDPHDTGTSDPHTHGISNSDTHATSTSVVHGTSTGDTHGTSDTGTTHDTGTSVAHGTSTTHGTSDTHGTSTSAPHATSDTHGTSTGDTHDTGTTHGTSVADAPCVVHAHVSAHGSGAAETRYAQGAVLAAVHEALTAETEQESAKGLADCYRAFGCGIFAASPVFVWDGSLRPTAFDAAFDMDCLVGYERQKRRLIENTELLLAGLPASNVLLYGDSGTGKSSSIRALLSMFADKGLKLISLPKSRLGDIAQIIDIAAGRGLKFIVFIDDLSFDEGEHGYKQFKSAVEGRISSPASGCIVCVTSNRRNIVKEVWKDRETQDDVHLRDNLQEKKSLADRFGLTLVYEAPDRKDYLAIVRGLAERVGLDMSGDELDREAMTWEIRHGGRSGRTAKSFVDYMYALQQIKRRGNQEK